MKEEPKIKADTEQGKGITLNEKSRVYIFPNKHELVIDEAVICYVSKAGTHRLQNKKGEIYIVPRQWLAIKIIEK